jgi:hypothetical protein
MGGEESSGIYTDKTEKRHDAGRQSKTGCRAQEAMGGQESGAIAGFIFDGKSKNVTWHATLSDTLSSSRKRTRTR